MTNPIGFIGLGNAGASVCKALLDKGQTVIEVDEGWPHTAPMMTPRLPQTFMRSLGEG